MIEAKVNYGAVHVEASAKDDATLVAEAAVMFLGVARSIVENSDDAGLAQFTLATAVKEVAKRIEAGKLDDGDELEAETETEEKVSADDFDKAIETIAKKIIEGLKK